MKSFIIAALCFACVAATAQTNNPTTMKEYSFIVRVPLTYAPEEVQAANKIWTKLIEQWKSDGIYIISFPFPGEGLVVSGKEKSMRKESVVSDNRRVVSTIFLKAENLDKAGELAKTFPVLEYNGSVEVREVFRPVPAK